MQIRPGLQVGKLEMTMTAGKTWAVILAGGEGVRLRPLIRHLYNEDLPKQYAVLMGDRSLLGQTLDRVARLVPPQRILVVTMASHLRYLDRDLRLSQDGPHVLAQPQDRGTAAAILSAAHWIEARDPAAAMMIFPSDHFVADEPGFARHAAIMTRFVEQQADWLVLLGICPTGPEPDFGWIQPGERMAAAEVAPIFRIRRFVEKPSVEMARAFWSAGALWNTFVVAGSVGAFIEAGRECVPRLEERLGRASAFQGAQEERWALGQAYALAPSANFSRSVLQMTTKPLAVAQMPDVGWHDLGTPARVLRMVRQLGLTPSWVDALESAAS
jgi:mannose-1-phosphate guanylyltransferase